MAEPKKKEKKVMSGLSYDETVKVIRALKGSKSIIGDEIAELCTVGKIRTGIPTIDFMGGGGITEGRITIFAGKPSSCKTTCILQIIPRIIDMIKEAGENKFVLYFDAEGGYDADYAATLGIDPKYMIVKPVKVMEDAFEEADELMSMGFIKAIVFDSFDAMVPKKSDENAYNNTMGSQSGAIAAHLPTLYTKIVEHNVTTFIVKQARVKMGYTGGREVITFNGGYALRHFSDTIFVVNRKPDATLTYCPIGIKAEKTRSSRMGLRLLIPNFQEGIDTVRDLVQIAKENGVITGSGWYTFKETKVQGLDNMIEAVRSNKALHDALFTEVYDTVISNSKIRGVDDPECSIELEVAD